MTIKSEKASDTTQLKKQLLKHWEHMTDSIGWLFSDLSFYFDLLSFQGKPLNGTANGQQESTNETNSEDQVYSFINIVRFAGGRISNDLRDKSVTHVVIGENRSRARMIREAIKGYVDYHWPYRDLREIQAQSITSNRN